MKKNEQVNADEIEKIKKLIGRIALDWFLLIGIFIPFVFVIVHVTRGAVPAGLWAFSLSTFGWKVGLHWVLAFYAIFITSFAVYKVISFSRVSLGCTTAIKILALTGAVFILIGSSLPVNDYHDFVDQIHAAFAQIGIFLIGMSALFMIYRYYRDTDGKMMGFVIPIIIFLIIGSIGFIMFRTGGHYQIALAFGAMVMLSYITIKYEAAPKKEIVPVSAGASMLLSWLSFLVPFFGFILYFKKRNITKPKARVYLSWAIACLFFWMLLAFAAYMSATHSCDLCGVPWRDLVSW